MASGKGRVRVGCCGFRSSRESYYGLLDSVEVQHTFYQPPQVATFRRWREEAPADFEFALKEILILPTADVVVPPSWADVVEKVDFRLSKAYGMCYLRWVVRSHVLQVFLQALTLGRSLAHLIADVEHAQNATGIEPLEDGHIWSCPGGLVNRCRGVFA